MFQVAAADGTLHPAEETALRRIKDIFQITDHQFNNIKVVYFKELDGMVETPCYDGDKLQNGNVIKGPAIVEETKTTVVLPKEYELTVDAYCNYMIRSLD